MADEVDDEVQSEPEEAAEEVAEEENDDENEDGGGDEDDQGAANTTAAMDPEPDMPINVRPIEMIRAHLRIGSAFKIFDHDDNNQVDARCVARELWLVFLLLFSFFSPTTR